MAAPLRSRFGFVGSRFGLGGSVLTGVFKMDSDDSQVPNDGPDDDRPAPRLRYDAPHEMPARPMFLRTEADRPDGNEQ